MRNVRARWDTFVTRPKALAVALLAGIFSGCFCALLVLSLKMPMFYSDAPKALAFTFAGLPIVVFFYQTVPLVSLAFLAMRGREPLTLPACILVVVCWLVVFLAFWHRQTIIEQWRLPMWAIQRDLVPLLAIMLATAWGFWRGWSGASPNHALKSDLGDAARPSAP